MNIVLLVQINDNDFLNCFILMQYYDRLLTLYCFTEYLTHYPITDDKISDWSKLKQIADDVLQCIQNEKYVPYKVENIVRKGEIACYKEILLFSLCFPQLYIFSASKCGI